MRMLCICAKGEPVGYLTIRGEPLDVGGVARAVSQDQTQVGALMVELERWGVFSRDRNQRIFSRRLVRDEERANILRKNGEKGGRPPGRWKETKDPTNPLASGSWDIGFLEFENWWKVYPHKVGKADAQKSYRRALEKTSHETLLAGLQAYISSKPKDRPWCNPATWLNQERWLDEPAEGGLRNEPDSIRFRRMLQHERDTGLWPWKTTKDQIPLSIRVEFGE